MLYKGVFMVKIIKLSALGLVPLLGFNISYSTDNTNKHTASRTNQAQNQNGNLYTSLERKLSDIKKKRARKKNNTLSKKDKKSNKLLNSTKINTSKINNNFTEFLQKAHEFLESTPTSRLEKNNYLREKFKKERNLQDMDINTEKIVREALKDCQVDQPVIILQEKDNSENGSSVIRPFVNNQKLGDVLLLSLESNLGSLLLPVLYHEIGHIVNKDLDDKQRADNTRLIDSIAKFNCWSVISGLYIIPFALHTFLSAKLLYNNRITEALANSGLYGLYNYILAKNGLTTKAVNYLNQQTLGKILEHNRDTELKADAFACEKLINLKKYYELAYFSLWFMFRSVGKKDRLKGKLEKDNIAHISVFTHPEDSLRAQCIIDKLKAAGQNITHLFEEIVAKSSDLNLTIDEIMEAANEAQLNLV